MVRPNLGGRLSPGLIALAACLALSASPAQAEAPSPQEPTLDVTRYRIEGKAPLSDAQIAAILAAHVGEKRSIAQIEQAAKALEKAFRDEGHVFHRVLVPVQKPEGGEVVLQVLAFNLAKVTVSGNQHFSTENILRSLPALRVGEPPDMDDLGRDLTAANVNPSKQAAITFREGASRSGVDADLRSPRAGPGAPGRPGRTGGRPHRQGGQGPAGAGPARGRRPVRGAGALRAPRRAGRDHDLRTDPTDPTEPERSTTDLRRRAPRPRRRPPDRPR